MGKKITSADNFKAILATCGVTLFSVIGFIFYLGQQTNDMTSRVIRNEKDIAELKLQVNSYTLAVTGIQKDVAVIQTTMGNISGQLGDIKETLKTRR